MDTSFDTWFSRFMWGTDIVFLVASMPHIAAWFAHFDNPIDFWSGMYAWGVGFALAIAIDGVSFMLLLAITRMIKQGKTKSKAVMIGLLAFMAFIALLSWGINWQYDTEFASNAFSKADAVKLFGEITVGSLNPIIGGAFQVLILAYALIGKATQGESKPAFVALSDEEFEIQKRALEQKQTLNNLRKSSNESGLFHAKKEQLLGKSKDAETIRNERLNATVDFLRDARELLDSAQEKRALTALSAFLKIKQKDALPLLIASRSTIIREEQKEQEDKRNQALSSSQNDEVSPVNEDVIDEESETQDEEERELSEEKSDDQNTEQIPMDLDVIRVFTHYPEIRSWHSTKKLTASIDEIVKATGKRKSTVEEAITKKQLKRSRSSELIRVSSVVSWLKTMPVRSKSNATKERTTGELEAVNAGD